MTQPTTRSATYRRSTVSCHHLVAALIAFAALSMASIVTSVDTATAQEAEGDQPRSTAADSTVTAQEFFAVGDQTTIVEPNGTFSITLETAEVELLSSTVEVDVEIYSLLEDSAALNTEPVGLLNRLPTEPAASLQTAEGKLEISFRIRGSSDIAGPGVLLPDPGVYPVVIDFSTQSEIVQSLRTNLVRLPQPPEAGNPVPALSPMLLTIDATEDRLALQQVSRLLLAASNAPAVVLIDAGTIAALERGGPTADAFIRNASEATVVLSPGADISVLASIGQTQLYEQWVQHLQRRSADLGLQLTPSAATTSALPTLDGVQALASVGVATVLHPSQTASKSEESGTLKTPSGDLHLLSRVSQAPIGQTGAAPWSNQFLANTVLGPASNTAETVSLLVVGEGVPAESESDALSMLLEGDGSLFRLVEIDEVPMAGQTLEPATEAATDLTANSEVIQTLVARINSYETSYVDGLLSPNNYRAALLSAIGQKQSDDQRTLQLERLDDSVQSEVQSIDLPNGQAVTVAAQSVPVPLAIENRSTGSRQFLLRSDSDKVEIAQNEQLLTVPPGSSSIDLDVEVRSLGVSPVQISLFTPDGQNRLASTRFEVRSTAIPGLGLLLCLVGAALLAFWWYVHAKRRRNKENERPSRDNDGQPNEPVADSQPNSTSSNAASQARQPTNQEVASGNLT